MIEEVHSPVVEKLLLFLSHDVYHQQLTTVWVFLGFFLVATNVTIALVLNAKSIAISFAIAMFYYYLYRVISSFTNSNNFISLENAKIARVSLIGNRNGFPSLELSTNSFQIRGKMNSQLKRKQSIKGLLG